MFPYWSAENCVPTFLLILVLDLILVFEGEEENEDDLKTRVWHLQYNHESSRNDGKECETAPLPVPLPIRWGEGGPAVAGSGEGLAYVSIHVSTP